MRIVVSGASGFIGPPLVEHLRGEGHDVVRLVRRLPRTADEVEWDPAAGELDVSALKGVQAAVNLSGAGASDHRWTPEYKRTIRDSRVDSSRTLSSALAQLDPLPQVLIQSSGMDYYGADRGDHVLVESDEPGDSFLVRRLRRLGGGGAARRRRRHPRRPPAHRAGAGPGRRCAGAAAAAVQAGSRRTTGQRERVVELDHAPRRARCRLVPARARRARPGEPRLAGRPSPTRSSLARWRRRCTVRPSPSFRRPRCALGSVSSPRTCWRASGSLRRC